MQANKLARDDEMFSLLRDLQAHNSDGHKSVPGHNRDVSQSSFMDEEQFTFVLGHAQKATDLMSYRTQKAMQTDEDKKENTQQTTEEMTPAPVAASPEPVNGAGPEQSPPKAGDDNAQAKAKKRSQKQEELAKAAAELEFFYLTCIAVKANLCEEFPEIEEQIQLNESPVELYKIAQAQAIEMSKFSIWIETRIRQKYGLPELKRSRKFKMPQVVLRRPSLHWREKLQHLLFQDTRKFAQSVSKAGEFIKSTVGRS
ncbi:hypothetical protein RFI_02055, partial [Reticulomyxa filosa]